MVIHEGGVQCNCGRKGCWETYASATGLIRMTKEVYEKTHSPILKQVIDSEGEINAKVAYIAARAGCEECEKITRKYAYYVAVGIANIINTFQPQIMCIGGGVSHEGKALLDPIKEFVSSESYTKDNPIERQTVIRLAELGNDAGIIGAALLYRNV
jgi:glucokinase